ncbi:MAG: squalene synthase HpnC [Pirellulales bacterium]
MSVLPDSLRSRRQLLAKLAFHAPDQSTWSLDAARAYTRELTRTHYENFTVASWLLPRRYRQPLADLYAYCRWADDLADEAEDATLSLQWLAWWQHSLDECWAGRTAHPVFIALDATRRDFDLPRAPFDDLLAAFRRDQVQTRYRSWDEVLDYCRGSANPVGRLVLSLAGARSDAHDRWSDNLCSGLQIANFCQDVARDAARGRIYLPRDTWTRVGCSERDFLKGVVTDRLRDAVAAGCLQASDLLEAGRPLLSHVPRWLRYDLELFLAGGHAVLRAIREQRYDVWSQRPTIGRWAKMRLAARAAWAGVQRVLSESIGS